MKKTKRKWTLIAGIALSLCLSDQYGQNSASGNSPAQRGSGDRGGGSRSGAIHAPSRSGSGHIGGGVSGTHQPAGPDNRNIGRTGGSHPTQRPNIPRGPSFSHPNPGGFRPGVTRIPSHRTPAIVGRAGIPRTISGNRSSYQNPGIDRRHINPVGISGSHFPNRLSGISSRPYHGNSLSLNSRGFSLGNSAYRPSYYRHSGYHGYWNGNRGSGIASALAYGLGSRLGYSIGSNSGYGWGLNRTYGYGTGNGYSSRYGRSGSYGYSPLGWGLGGWGLGSLNYSSGYLSYSNPYYTTTGWTGYNYAQPITVSYNTPMTVADSSATSSDTVLNNAVAAFRQNDYDAALDITNKGITQYSDDAVLHEFRSLVLFAKQDYQQSAATIHSVLAVGPGWDWTTMSGMYADVGVYTTQLRALEAFTKSNPQDAASLFLLAYHYLSCGHTAAAAIRMQQVVTLKPNDRVAVEMLRMITPPDAADSSAFSAKTAASPEPSDQTAAKDVEAVDPRILVGAWSATRDDGSQFKLNLTDDEKFTWTFKSKGHAADSFDGTYTVEDNVLALERKDGGSLIAEVTAGESGAFNFRLIGAAADDHGLDFSK
jgi:tetratricopeptide (TPR) repeat protein